MKAKNFLILIMMSVFTFSSCELTELEDNLTNPNAPSEDNLDVDFLYNTVQLNFPGIFVTASDLTMPAVRMMAMTGGNVYDNAWGPTSFDGIWSSSYAGLLVNIDALVPAAQEKELWNYVGMAKVFESYTLMTLVDLFGDVPYSEALQGTNVISPNADSQEAVYAAALTLLDEAMAEFDKGSTVWPPEDIIYGGDATKWKKLVNTLKLRYYLQTKLVDGSAAGAFQSIINSGVFIQEGDDFIFEAGNNRANPNSRHPYYNEHYENGNGRYLSNYYMWLFRDEAGMVDDPRRKYYFYRQNWDYTSESEWNQFTLGFVDFTAGFDIAGRPGHYDTDHPFGMATIGTSILDSDGYLGRDHGNNDGIPPDGQLRTNFGVYPAGGKFDAGDPDDASTFSHVKNNGVDGALGEGIGPIMLASYVYFMRAEAALTMNTGEDAKALYEAGVRESIRYVLDFADNRGQAGGSLKPSDDDVEAYVTKALSDYDAATDKLDAVMREWYKAAWTNGLDMYNAYRRTGLPSSLQPTREPNSGGFPRSMFYPANYVNSNQNASQKSLPLSDQVFWDTNSNFPEQ